MEKLNQKVNVVKNDLLFVVHWVVLMFLEIKEIIVEANVKLLKKVIKIINTNRVSSGAYGFTMNIQYSLTKKNNLN